MTDEIPENSPEDDARIRALLAELGSGPDGESMPPEVSARLDDTLARLVAERTQHDTASEAAGNVVPLRRRWGARLTAAAAAVIVLGAGGVAAANLDVFGGSSGDSATSGSDAGGSAAKSEARAPSPSTPDDASRKAAAQAEALPRVRSTSFAADAGRLVKQPSAGVVVPSPTREFVSGESEKNDDSSGRATNERRPAAELSALGCPGPKITDDAVPNPIVYDGRVAVLVVHPEKAGRQVVEAWTCTGDRKLDSATVTP